MARSALVIAALIGFATFSPAQAQNRTQVGTLVCDIAPGFGFVVGSQKEVMCQFRPSEPGWRADRYVGAISKFGLDIGATAGGQMVWAVFAPTSRRNWALTGDYGGASAEATVGAGLGANVLVGGSDRTVSLQPLSIQGQTGLNVAAGVTQLSLRPARPYRRHR
jgi:hypothetical protein